MIRYGSLKVRNSYTACFEPETIWKSNQTQEESLCFRICYENVFLTYTKNYQLCQRQFNWLKWILASLWITQQLHSKGIISFFPLHLTAYPPTTGPNMLLSIAHSSHVQMLRGWKNSNCHPTAWNTGSPPPLPSQPQLCSTCFLIHLNHCLSRNQRPGEYLHWALSTGNTGISLAANGSYESCRQISKKDPRWQIQHRNTLLSHYFTLHNTKQLETFGGFHP